MAKSELPPSYNNEWRNSQGQVFQLCVIHEIRGQESIIAVVDIAGYSVCRECLDQIVNLYKNSHSGSLVETANDIIEDLIEDSA